ncbi:inversin [Halyomorpha halys]|uniref:inversin n=1 Tax=Halyomorpha halys TaxID=286706 RepID=UPI0034D32CD5
MLLKAAAIVEAVDINGMTPLHFAAKERHSGVVQSLIKYNTNIFYRNINGSTPLHLACERNGKSTRSEKDVVSMLLDHSPFYTSDDKGMTPLHIGARDNSMGCVVVSLLFGADIFKGDTLLNLPINFAALNGNLEIVSMFLQMDPEISSKVNSDEETPLFIASREGHTDIVALLLQFGVKGLRPDIKGRTALHRSASRGHLEIVKLIREFRINTEMEDKWGFTALNYAASWRGHQEVIGYLSTPLLNITLTSYFDKSNPS